MPCLLPFNAQTAPQNLTKNQAETIRIETNWEPLTDTVSTSTWSVFPTGAVTLSNPGTTLLRTRVDAAAGNPGQLYEITNTVTTPTETLTQKYQLYVGAIPTIFEYVPLTPEP